MPFAKLELDARSATVDGHAFAAPSGAALGSGNPPTGEFYDRIKGCSPSSAATPPRTYEMRTAAAVPYDEAAATMEAAAFAGFGVVTLDTGASPLRMHVLPVGANGMQVSLIDQVAAPTEQNPSAGSDEEAPPAQDPFGQFRRPVQVVLLRIASQRVEAVWADQVADDPIVERFALDTAKLAALRARFKRACASKSLRCDRVLVESEHAVAFDVVRRVLAAFAAARSKTDPLKTEFVLLDASASAAERAAARIGVALESGHLAKEAVDSVIRANFGRINTCYAAGLKRNPALSGRLVVRLVVDSQGHTQDVADARQPEDLDGDPALGTAPAKKAADKSGGLADSGVVSCILDVFRGLEFPPPQGGSVKLFYPLNLSPR